MKTTFTIITAWAFLICMTSAQADTSEIESEIIGSWLAGETFMPQPPPDMQQDHYCPGIDEADLKSALGSWGFYPSQQV